MPESNPNIYPANIGRINALRLGRIANQASKLPEGRFVRSHYLDRGNTQAKVSQGQASIHVGIKRREAKGPIIWQTNVDISFSGLGLPYETPYVSASLQVLDVDDVLSERVYSASDDYRKNSLGLYEIARAVRVAKRVCSNGDMSPVRLAQET